MSIMFSRRELDLIRSACTAFIDLPTSVQYVITEQLGSTLDTTELKKVVLKITHRDLEEMVSECPDALK